MCEQETSWKGSVLRLARRTAAGTPSLRTSMLRALGKRRRRKPAAYSEIG